MSQSSNSSSQAAGQPSILSNLTFGIEFEFLAYAPEHVNPQKSAMKALRRPVGVQCTKCQEIHSFVLPVEGTLEVAANFELWTSHKDVSVTHEGSEAAYLPDEYRFFPLEIVSRVLNFTKPTPDPLGQIYPCTGEPYEWSAQTEIACILSRLTESFSRSGFLLCTNATTGLHTHWGNGDEEMPPTKTSLGMFGVFTALERLFDGILPVSRIGSQKIRGPLLGIIRPDPLYSYTEITESMYVGSGTRVFLEDLARTVRNAMDQDPEQQTRSTIYGALKNCNVPAWLVSMSTHEDVEAFLDSWPPTTGRGRAALSQRSIAVNVTNLQNSYGTKATIEVRATPGSSDITEVWAWCDFMGKLVLWLSTPGIEHNAIIVGIWADPQSSILDLLRQVGASQSTFDFYTDRLSPDWAERRHSHLISDIVGHPFEQFIRAIEENRHQDCRRFHVDAKIQDKLEAGLYGLHPDAFLRVKLPREIYMHPDSLILNMDKCNFESRTDKIIQDARALAAAKAGIPDKKTYSFAPRPGHGSGSGSSNTTSTHNSLVPPALFTRASAPPNTPRLPSDLDDPFTTTSAEPTPSRPDRPPPATVRDLADLIQEKDRDVVMDDDSEWNSSLPAGTPSQVRPSPTHSEDFPFRATTAAQRTFAQLPPEGGFPDTRPESPDSDVMDEP